MTLRTAVNSVEVRILLPNGFLSKEMGLSVIAMTVQVSQMSQAKLGPLGIEGLVWIHHLLEEGRER